MEWHAHFVSEEIETKRGDKRSILKVTNPCIYLKIVKKKHLRSWLISNHHTLAQYLLNTKHYTNLIWTFILQIASNIVVTLGLEEEYVIVTAFTELTT